MVNLELAERLKRMKPELIPPLKKTWLSARMVDCILHEADTLTDHQRRWGSSPGGYAYHHGGLLILDSHVTTLVQHPTTKRYSLFLHGFGTIPPIALADRGRGGIPSEIRFDFRPSGNWGWLMGHTQFTCAKTYGLRSNPVGISFTFEAGKGTVVPLLDPQPPKRGPGRPRKSTAVLSADDTNRSSISP